MQREAVQIPDEEIKRQEEFRKRIRDAFAGRQAHPLACVETFGCPLVRV